MGKFYCEKCLQDNFISKRGLEQHKRIKHPFIPPPPPKVFEKSYIGQVFGQRLVGGQGIGVGDKLRFEQVVVVKRMQKTEVSDVVVVDCDKVSDTFTNLSK